MSACSQIKRSGFHMPDQAEHHVKKTKSGPSEEHDLHEIILQPAAQPDLGSYYLRKRGIAPGSTAGITKYFTALMNSDCIAPLHVRKTEENQLAASLIYVPRFAEKASEKYILLKGLPSILDVGQGGENRVTLALNWETGKIDKVFRSAVRTEYHESEIEANVIFSNYPRYFAAGTPVEYRGTKAPRIMSAMRRKKAVDKVGFLMRYLPEGNLSKAIQRMETHSPEEKINTYKTRVKIALRIAESLQIMHESGWVHRDIKPDNILMEDSESPVICDFGMTVRQGSETHPGGTEGFMAPEEFRLYFKGDETIKAETPADIWSFGCVLKTMLPPGNYETDPFSEIIRGCLEIEPERRMKIREIIAKLQTLDEG